MTKILGYSGEWPDRFHYSTEWPRAEAGGLENIAKWVASVPKPRLVVVDVLTAFRSPRANQDSQYEADYKAVSGLQKIASGSDGLAIVPVHHLRKSLPEADPFEKVSGTLGLSGAADTVIILDRDGNGTTLYGRGRDIEEIERAVQFNRETCRWTVLGEAAETDERGRVLTVLMDADEALSPQEIATQAEMVRSNVDVLLLRMRKAGEVQRVSRGRYVHPDRADLMKTDLSPPGKNDKKVRNGGADTER